MNHRVSDRFKIASTAYLARTKSDRGITGNDNTNKSYNFSFGFTPNFVDIRQNADGSWPDHPTNPSNPLHTVEVLTNEETVNRATGSVSADYTVFRTGSSSFSLNSNVFLLKSSKGSFISSDKHLKENKKIKIINNFFINFFIYFL